VQDRPEQHDHAAGAPGGVLTAAALSLVAAVVLAPVGLRGRAVGLATVILAVPIGLQLGGLAPFDVLSTKGHETDRVLFSKWNSFSRIAVYDEPFGGWALSDRYSGPLPEARLMDIDSAAATQILKFSGDLRDVSYLQYELTAFGYRLLGAPASDNAQYDGDPPAAPYTALVIGTGGGRDLLSALAFGATAVETGRNVAVCVVVVGVVLRVRVVVVVVFGAVVVVVTCSGLRKTSVTYRTPLLSRAVPMPTCV